MAALRPIHVSIAGRPRLPNRMDRLPMPPEMAEGMSEIALTIWADCINAGQPFQQALLAVYLSGLQHGLTLSSLTKEKNDD